MSIRNRLRKVESQVVLRASNSVEAIEARIEGYWQEAIVILIDHLPASRRQAALDLLVPGDVWWAPGHIDRPDEGHYIRHTPVFDNPGLRALHHSIWAKRWLPDSELPEVVVDAYLTYPCLTPSLSCKACAFLVPYRWGYWTRPDRTDECQGPLVPFQDCPRCQARCWEPSGGYYLKWMPEPGWSFRCDDRKCSHAPKAAPTPGATE